MRIRPNQYRSASEHSHWEYNDLYRRFNREFDFLLQGDGPRTLGETSCYVKNTQIEDRLEIFSSSPVDTVQFLIGRTGIGKSTLLLNQYKTTRKPVFDKDRLVIPLSFDNRNIEINELDRKLGATLMSASSTLAKKHEISANDLELLNFMNTHCPDVPLRGAAHLNESAREIMDRLRENDYFAYTLEFFKFHIQAANLPRVLIVVDDMESERHELQELIIEHMCRTFKCLTNAEDKSYTVGLLFSVRPITEKLVRKNQAISAFSMGRAIIIKKPIPLSELFKERLNYATQNIGLTHIKNIDSWNKAYESLIYIVESISDQYGYGILALFNNNIRRSLVEFQYLITNRTWLQRDEDPAPAFRVEEGKFSITPASVYRTLGMRNGKVYPVEGTCLVNVFFNKPEPNYDLLCLFLIRYMIVLNRENEYLDQTANTEEIRNCFNRLFCIQGFDTVFKNVIERMRELKLIEIEIRDSKNGSTQNYIGLLPRSRQIWKLLSQNAILLEMYRDDTYQEFKGRDRKLSTSLKPDSLFIELFVFFDQIASWEKSYIGIFKKK